MIVPVPEFAPDQPDLPSISSDTVFNVIPVTDSSYGPLPSHKAFSSALTARCQGGITVSDNSGNVHIYAGDATKLYRITSPGTTPADVSKALGYSTSSVGGWSFTSYGSRVIATNYNNVPQSYVEGSSTLFADLITSGVTDIKAKYAAIIKNWLFLANTTDGTYGAQPQRVWWSAINDPTNFPTPGTTTAANNLSDYQDIIGPHGQVKGIAGNLGAADGAAFMERAVWRIVYTGMPDIFTFVPAEGARGLLVSGGLNQFGSNVAYPTEDGFYMFDGANSTPIGKGKIDKFFYNDLQTGYIDRVSCCSDPSRGLLVWAYPGQGASNGAPNRLLIYSAAFNKWTATELNAVSVEYLLRGATFGTTLEALASFGTLDSLPFSLDSPVWTGNRSVLSAFDASHKFGYFDGANLEAKVDTSDTEAISRYLSVVNRVAPLVDAAAATVGIASRNSLTSPPSYTAQFNQESDGTVPLRSAGRYHRLRLKIPSGTSWNQFSGYNVIDVQKLGTR